MNYSINLEQYKILQDFNTPLAIDNNEMANCEIGDSLFIIDEIVYITHKNDEYKDQFFRAIYEPDFVRINPNLFEKIL